MIHRRVLLVHLSRIRRLLELLWWTWCILRLLVLLLKNRFSPFGNVLSVHVMLNALTGRKAIARTSVTPGRTQELNYFDVGGGESGPVQFRLVDMPGYGFAKAPLAQAVARSESPISPILLSRSERIWH